MGFSVVAICGCYVPPELIELYVHVQSLNGSNETETTTATISDELDSGNTSDPDIAINRTSFTDWTSQETTALEVSTAKETTTEEVTTQCEFWCCIYY